VLSYFPLFIFDVICRKSEMLRLVRTSAITAFGRSRPAADATREVVERWFLDGDVYPQLSQQKLEFTICGVKREKYEACLNPGQKSRVCRAS